MEHSTAYQDISERLRRITPTAERTESGIQYVLPIPKYDDFERQLHSLRWDIAHHRDELTADEMKKLDISVNMIDIIGSVEYLEESLKDETSPPDPIKDLAF